MDNNPQDEADSFKSLQAKLQAQLAEIQELRLRLHEQAIRDPLTNLFNRLYMQETLARELAAATRRQGPVALILVDVDHQVYTSSQTIAP